MTTVTARRATRIGVDECIHCPFVLHLEDQGDVWMCRPPAPIGEPTVLSYDGQDGFAGPPPDWCPLRDFVVLIAGPRSF